MKIQHLVPMLETDDLPATIDFYTKTLGFKLTDSAGNDEEGVYWCNLNRDAVHIMFTVRNLHSKPAQATLTGVLYFYPDEVDPLWEEYKNKVKVEWEPQDFGYGMYDFAIRDNNDFILAFGMPIKPDSGN